MVKMSVTITDHQAALIQRAIESGNYMSASEAIRDALRNWEQGRLMFLLAEDPSEVAPQAE